jgi:membrane fusion protein (multidrug efflux system)
VPWRRKIFTGSPGSGRSRKAQEAPKNPKQARRRRFLLVPAAILLVVAVAGGGYLYWDNARRFETTDDAFIAGRQFAIAPKVSGYIVSVPVTDNEHVRAGNVIARIDERDYRLALKQAEAQVAAAQASIENIDAQAAVQQAQVAQNRVQVEQAQASLTFAQQQADRYGSLARSGAGSVENAEQYGSQQRVQEAALKTALASLTAADRQLAAITAQRGTAEANLEQQAAQRDQAKLNLSYTAVTTAQPGRIANLTAAVGQYVQAGTNLTMFVPDAIWVVANFKESQLDKMRPGQTVDLRIDAYSERSVHGHVASVQLGSGTAFSLLPAENATGNYVKIVQRVPVKIVMDDPPDDVTLGPGMSVEPTARIDPGPSLLERPGAWL